MFENVKVLFIKCAGSKKIWLRHCSFFVISRNTGQQQSSSGGFDKQTLDKLINNNQQYDSQVRPTVKNTTGKLLENQRKRKLIFEKIYIFNLHDE